MSAPKPYFCHQCDRTVSISLSPSSELVCPLCNGGFLEEFENPNPNPNPSHAFFSEPFSSPFGLAGFPLVFSSSSGGFDLQHPSGDPLSASRRSSSASEPDAFNPMLFLQNYLHTLMAGGANIQFVVENNSDPSGGGAAFRLPSNFGDYFLGPGLEQLIQHLAENDPNRYGTPPASKSAIESLPDVTVTEQLLASDSAQCAVCMDTFELGAGAKQMPCKHIFHPDCILPWLALHNSCPVCRFELPTDDPDYENRVRGAPPPASASHGAGDAASGSGGGSAGLGESGASPTSDRRVRISIPWPVRVFRSPAETSDGVSGSRSNDNSNDSERNFSSANQRANQDPGPEAMPEDLD